MFGSFSESALLAYAEKVKKVAAKQGAEWADTAGIGKADSTFIDTDESQDTDDYAEWYDFTTCIRSNGTLYGIAPGKKCRKGSETDSVSKEDKKRAQLKAKVLKAIEADPKVAYARKQRTGRHFAMKQRQAFIKANRYPEANEGMRRQVEKIRKEIAELNKDILREKRRIAKQIASSEVKENRLQRAGRLAATKVRAEKVLADIRKEQPESDTMRSAREGVFNRSRWD